jgi:ribose transport system substrate-binding protein
MGEVIVKLITYSVVAVFLALLSTGCGESKKSSTERLILDDSPGGSSQRASQKKTVALVMKTLTNPFFKSMEKGARQAEDELGIELIVKTGARETSIEQQVSIVKDLIRAKVDAIVIAPGSSTELIPVLKEARDAGIVIINIDNRLDPGRSAEMGLGTVPFISVDNEHGAYLSAKVLASRITTPTKVALIEGIRTAQNAQDRKRGAMRAFEDNPSITVVASESANWKIDEGYQVMARLMTQHPDLGAVFCANDMMALGAVRYLTENDNKNVLVAAYDNLDEAQSAIRRGELVATIDQQASVQGHMGVHFAMRALNGEVLPDESLVEVKLITAETLEQGQ